MFVVYAVTFTVTHFFEIEKCNVCNAFHILFEGAYPTKTERPDALE